MKKNEATDACYLVNEAEAAVVRDVFTWYTQELLSIGAIARRLNDRLLPTRFGKSRWERSKVWAMLRNPAYMGRAAFGKTERAERKRITRPLRQKGGYSARSGANRERAREQWIELSVPALVSEEAFARAGQRLEENRHFSARNTKEPTLLQGLLVCGHCGYSLYRTSTRTTKRQAKYYRCLGSDRYRHLKDPPCPCRPIRVEDIDGLVWAQVTDLLEKPELIRAELERRRQESLQRDPLELRKEQLAQELKRVEQQIDKLLDAYQEGLVPLGQLRHRMPELRRRQQTVEKEAESARWQALAAEQAAQLEQSLESFVARLRHSAQSLSVLDRQKVVRLLVKEIIVEIDNRITIRHCLPLMGGVRNAAGSTADCYLVRLGSHRSPLRGASLRVVLDAFFHDSRLKPLAQQPQDYSITDPLTHQFEQSLPIDAIEVFANIHLQHPTGSKSHEFFPEFGERLMCCCRRRETGGKAPV